MLRSERVMLFINPNSSNSMTGSGRSKSIEPLRSRLRFRISARSRISSKRGHQFGVALARAGIAFEHHIHVGVSHAFDRANDAFAQFVADNFSVMIHFHHA